MRRRRKGLGVRNPHVPFGKSLAGDAGGSVLMETVLAIPLFLVLIGGIFWLGELMLAKHQLAAADRFAAWNAGNRHTNDAGDIQAKLQDEVFPPERVGDQQIESIDFEN